MLEAALTRHETGNQLKKLLKKKKAHKPSQPVFSMETVKGVPEQQLLCLL